MITGPCACLDGSLEGSGDSIRPCTIRTSSGLGRAPHVKLFSKMLRTQFSPAASASAKARQEPSPAPLVARVANVALTAAVSLSLLVPGEYLLRSWPRPALGGRRLAPVRKRSAHPFCARARDRLQREA